MPENIKIQKINSLISNYISEIIKNRYDTIFSVVEVRTNSSLEYAKVFISTMNDDSDFVHKLNLDAKVIRKILAKKIKLRSIPSILFELDLCEKYVEKIDKLLIDV